MAAKSASPAGPQILEEIGFADLPKDWDIIRVEDLLSDDRGISVGVMYPGHHDPDGIPLIKAGDLTDNRITARPEFRITIDKHHEYRRTELAGGELLISLVGDVGRCALVQPQMARWNAARAVAVLRFVSPTDAAFVRLCLMSSPLQHLMQSWATTTVQATLNLKEIRQIPLPWPPKEQRDSIVHILGTLDDKIELNRRMNETLEAMARTIFKSWFVDFDPVRAKAEGRDPALPKHIADLFPDRFEDSDLGEIPMGWKVGPILKQAKLLSGGTPKTDRKEYWDGDILWASAKDVSQCGQTFLTRTERSITRKGLEESATQLIPSFCTVVVARGATTGRMVMFGREMAMNQICYALASITDTAFALYCHLQHEIDTLVYSAHGSVFDTITTNTFANSKVVLPPMSLLKAFDQKVAPIFHRIIANTAESQTLTAIRDRLLPKLISGRLRLNNIGKILEVSL